MTIDEELLRKLWAEALEKFPWDECLKIFGHMQYKYGADLIDPDEAALRKCASMLFEEGLMDLHRGSSSTGLASGRLSVRLKHYSVNLDFVPFGAFTQDDDVKRRYLHDSGMPTHWRNIKTMPDVAPCGAQFGGPSSDPRFALYNYATERVTCPECIAAAAAEAP